MSTYCDTYVEIHMDINNQDLVDSLGFDHSFGHCYTGATIVYRRIIWVQCSLESLHLAVNDSVITRNINRQ